jgi:hypothetical protein
MPLLMTALASKLGPFMEVRISNSEIGSDWKSGDNEESEKESRKEPKKKQPSSRSIAPSMSLFKMEVKVDIKQCKGDIDALNLNHWLQQLEVYFSVHNIYEE